MTSGYLVLPELFPAPEIARLRDAAEQVHSAVVSAAESGETSVTVWPDGHRLEEIHGTRIHWEPDAPGKAVRSLAPVAQLHPALAELWTEPRLTEPMETLIGASVGPFVSKLNFKRAGVGSEFAWHQDFPYWYCCAGDAAYDIATAIVMLDDNTVENGAMTLVPGSQLAGPARRGPLEPTGLFVDPRVVDESRAVTVTAPAGSVLMFPGLMVHRSAPNRTGADRRSLLYCFQPAGRPELSALTYDAERLADLP
ncbi:phytanoyl-CoA dioxygenase family protein [Kribbella sp. CA-293567]|uniref:phytanoyl-CoA dioxygenase family protein n=1 Tax=Kribbella sp. CA-293567 TaxID=3002436 RepID=UPI0022DE7D3E|nr:phytanoyl-CoA dioxygenase family protein [Kribbella sp. CA-293567]WBQ06746.1 phytanoyl-CoA dioxygenase family protein [Kribbella sp. CA-293567]